VRRLPAALALLTAMLVLPVALAGADSFNPITLTITVTPVARLAKPLHVKVAVTADPSALPSSDEGPYRVEVKLASECGGDFQHTPGTTLINKQLEPTPAVDQAYSGGASGSGKPTAYGVQTVCSYIETSLDGRVYAHDESVTVNVSQACTKAGWRYDAANRALKRARRRLRRAHSRAAKRRARKLVAKRRRTLSRDRRRGVAACGKGVKL
jgi:hypothetical protein